MNPTITTREGTQIHYKDWGSGQPNQQPNHLRLVPNSDVFAPTGRRQMGVIWDLSVNTGIQRIQLRFR